MSARPLSPRIMKWSLEDTHRWRSLLLPYAEAVIAPMDLEELRFAATRRAQSPDAVWSRLVSELEKDLPRTANLNERQMTDVRSLLLTYCCVRNPSIGYVQGMSCVAAVLCSVLATDDALQVFAALIERVAPHSFAGGSLHGVHVDLQVLEWYLGKTHRALLDHVRRCDAYSAPLLFCSDLVSLLAESGLSVEVVLELWGRLLRARNPRVELLRIIAAAFAHAEDVVCAADSVIALQRSKVESPLRAAYADASAAALLALVDIDARTVADSAVLARCRAVEEEFVGSATRHRHAACMDRCCQCLHRRRRDDEVTLLPPAALERSQQSGTDEAEASTAAQARTTSAAEARSRERVAWVPDWGPESW